MSLLERPTVGIDMSKPISVARPAVKISFGSRKAIIDAQTGPTDHEHFVQNHDAGLYFKTTGWLALGAGSSDPNKFIVAHPWLGSAEPSLNRLGGGPETQAFFYISGVSAEDICFESLRSVDTSDVDADLDLVEVSHEEGNFERPYAYLVVGGEPTRRTTYTDRFVIEGIGGVDRATLFCALEPVQSGRQVQ